MKTQVFWNLFLLFRSVKTPANTMFKTDNIQTVQSVLTVSAGKMQNSVLFARLGETKVCIFKHYKQNHLCSFVCFTYLCTIEHSL